MSHAADELILGKPLPVLSRSEFLALGSDKVMRRNEPCLIQWYGAEEAEAAAAALRSALGPTPVALFRKSVEHGTRQRSQISKIRLHDFFNLPQYQDTSSGYVHRVVTNIKKKHELINTVLGEMASSLFDYIGEGNYVNVWINFKGQFGRSHFDDLENFNLQLEGVKRFICLPPGRRNYYTRSLLMGVGHHSQVADFSRADLNRFPRLKDELPKAAECVLVPGQMLYLPLGWWHQVDPLGDVNINMNFWLSSPKLRRHPYIWADSVYKEIFRRLTTRYDYQPDADLAAGPQS